MLDLRRLRMLRELARRGTLTAVAEALNYSTSTISQQLALLEAEAGVRLLEPAGRRVRLTPAAQLLAGHTETLLAQMEEAEAALAAARSGPSIIRVASFQTAALTLGPPALDHLRNTHSTLRVELTLLEPELSVPALIAGSCDLAVVEEYPHHPLPVRREIERSELMHDELLLACPSSWGSDLDRLAARPWVMEPEGTAARDWSAAACRAAGFEPDVQFTATDLLMHRTLVEAGLAAALLPRLSGITTTPATSVTPLPGSPHRRVSTVVRRGAGRHPGVVAVRDALKTALSAPTNNEDSATARSMLR